MNMEKQKVMPSKEEQSPDRAVLRTFDQRAAPERRAALADELRTLRRERAVGTHSSQEEIFTVEQAMEQHSASPAEAAEELETISEETQTRQASAVSDITDIFRLKQLRAATGIVERKEGDLAADIQRNEATLATLDALAADRLTLATARARLAEYYKTVGEEFEAFEAEAVGRDIGALMQKHEAFFFHGITTDTGDVQQQNGVIHANVPAKDRLKLLLAVAPTISTSSIKQGSVMSGHALWSRVGVVIAGGYVEGAGTSDIASIGRGITSRTIDAKHVTLESVSEAIENRGQGWNELSVREPQIAGCYVWADTDQEWPIHINAAEEETFNAAQEQGLPLYVVIDGEMFPASLTEDGVLPGPEALSPRELLDAKPTPIDDAQRRELQEEVLTDAMFNTDKFAERVPEAAYIQGLRTGRHMAQRLRNPPRDDYTLPTNDARRAYIATSKERGVYRGAVSGREVRVEDMTDEEHEQMASEFTEAHKTYRGISSISLGGGNNASSGEHPLQSMREYPQMLESALKQVGGSEPTLDNDGVRVIIGHCYGFAEALESGEHPDHETAEQLRAIAERFMPRVQFEEIKARRLNDQGYLRFSAAEIA